ncbi:MAG: hypothetical protein ABW166_07150 [Sedimenticola sp.]
MYLLDLHIRSPSNRKTTLFSADRTETDLRKWSLLPQPPENSQRLQLIALTCAGRRFAEHLPYPAPAPAPANQTITLDYRIALHPPFDGACRSSVDKDHLAIKTNQENGPVDGHIGHGVSVKNIRKTDNANRFSLAYGKALCHHIGTDDFDFNNPLFKLDRYRSLFDGNSRLTDPVAFLNRLHYKAIRCGRYPAKQTLQAFCSLFSEHLGIDTDRWQEKGHDFNASWSTLERRLRDSILPILDMTRHLMDAFPKSGKPLRMHGVVLFDRPDNLCAAQHLPEWIGLVDELFPNIQFIATLPAEKIAQIPDRILSGRIGLPKKTSKPTPGTTPKISKVEPNTILLFHIDGRLPNLALMKLSSYYKSLGYNIELSKTVKLIGGAEHLFAGSVFFTKSSQQRIAKLKRYYGDDITIGGTGVDLKLRLPPEVEAESPDYDLYPELGDRAIGFITRGCPYRCKFCLVPDKEGGVRRVSDLDELLRGRDKLILLDDNLLAFPGVGGILEQMARRDLTVNFTQTLDIRMLDRDMVVLLKRVGWSNTRFTRPVIHFSLNGLSGLDRVSRNYQLFDFQSRDNVEFICMYDYDTTLEEDVERFRFIRSLPGAYVFVQQYQPTIGAPPKPEIDFFGSNTDRLIDQLIKIVYRQNMKSMEKYYRWLSRRYAQQYGRIHQGLVDVIFRYNGRDQKGLYITSLLASAQVGPVTAGRLALHPDHRC